jgi:hypothetical protein
MTIRLASFVLAALIVSTSHAAQAADRKWQTGTWRDSGDARTYVIVAATVRVHLEDVPATDKRAFEAPAGASVKYAVEGNRAFVLDTNCAWSEPLTSITRRLARDTTSRRCQRMDSG